MMQEGLGVLRWNQYEDAFELLHGNGMHPILRVSDNSIEYQRPRFGYEIGHR